MICCHFFWGDKFYFKPSSLEVIQIKPYNFKSIKLNFIYEIFCVYILSPNFNSRKKFVTFN